MATVLFIGGVSPDVTQDDLHAAFSQHAQLLAVSVVRNRADGKCVGQAYVTVGDEDVAKAVTVTEVGGNGVCVFPVDVEAWVAPPAGVGGGSGVGGTGLPAGGGGGGGWVSTPSPAPGLAADHTGSVHLNEVMEMLNAQLAINPRIAYNGKTYATLLNEACQKLHMTPQVAEGAEGAAFVCTITVTNAGGAQVSAGRATGPSKRDAKHNAAAACLDQLLAARMVRAEELVVAMTCAAPAGGAGGAGAGGAGGVGGAGVGGAGVGLGGLVATTPAATAMSQTQGIMRLGLYPGCEEVMRQVQATEQGRVKTVLMVLNEYVVRARLAVQHEEKTVQVPGSTGPPTAFKFTTRLTDARGEVVAQATGAERPTKQEAKQAAAAAVVEYLLAHKIATADAIARGGK